MSKKQSSEFPMRVMLVIHSMRGGGSERQMSYLANEIAISSDTCLVTLDGTGNEAYPLDPRIERFGLQLASGRGGFLRGLLANLRRVRSLRKKIRGWSPDAVVSFCDSTNILTLIACPSTIPVLISERSDPRRQRLSHPWEWLRNRFYPRAHTCVAQTREVGDYLVERKWIAPSKIVVIPSAIRIPDLDVQTLESQRLSQGPKTLVFLGRLSREKRVDRLLHAWSTLTSHHPSWQLRIVGDGSERVALQELASRLGFQHSVQWDLWSDNVWASLRSANAYCLVSDYEGFPQSMLEAMATGLPVAVLDCSPAIRHTLSAEEGHECGLIIPSEDKIVSGLDRLMESETLRVALGRNAAKRARDFEWSAIAPLWMRALAGASP